MPPPDGFKVPIVHKIALLYKDIYLLGKKLPKRNKFGIHARIESVCLELLILSIKAAFKEKQNKKSVLEKLRIEIEVLKHLIRLCREIKIIDNKNYISLQEKIQEISKMTNGWLKYLTQKEL